MKGPGAANNAEAFDALLMRSFEEPNTGHYASALATQREALALDIARGADRSAQITNTLIADTLSEMGRFGSATANLRPIIDEARKSGDAQTPNVALEKRGIVQARVGETDAALASLRELARIEESLGGGDSLASVWLRIAQLQADQHQLQEARELPAKAQAEMVRSAAEELLAARNDYLQAAITFAAGDPAVAVARLQDAISRWRKEDRFLSLVDGLNFKARMYRSLGW